MDKNKKEAVQDLKSEQVQEEIMAVAEAAEEAELAGQGDPSPPDGLEDPLVISLKAERVEALDIAEQPG